MDFDPKVIEALDYLRKFIAVDARAGTQQAFSTLDEAGVFAPLDEAVQSDRAEAILAESARDACLCGGSYDGRRGGLGCTETAVSRPGKLERVPSTDTLRPAHEHVFRSPHSDEICYGAEWCTVTYREHRRATRGTAADPEWTVRKSDAEIDAALQAPRRSHGSLAADND